MFRLSNFFIERRKIFTKTTDNTKAKSMDSLLKSGQVKHGIKLASKNVGGTEQVDSYPLYMAMFI